MAMVLENPKNPIKLFILETIRSMGLIQPVFYARISMPRDILCPSASMVDLFNMANRTSLPPILWVQGQSAKAIQALYASGKREVPISQVKDGTMKGSNPS